MLVGIYEIDLSGNAELLSALLPLYMILNFSLRNFRESLKITITHSLTHSKIFTMFSLCVGTVLDIGDGILQRNCPYSLRSYKISQV